MSQSALKLNIIQTSVETQLKIHFQSFPRIAYNTTTKKKNLLCDPVYEYLCFFHRKHAFVHLNNVCQFYYI